MDWGSCVLRGYLSRPSSPSLSTTRPPTVWKHYDSERSRNRVESSVASWRHTERSAKGGGTNETRLAILRKPRPSRKEDSEEVGCFHGKCGVPTEGSTVPSNFSSDTRLDVDLPNATLSKVLSQGVLSFPVGTPSATHLLRRVG